MARKNNNSATSNNTAANQNVVLQKMNIKYCVGLILTIVIAFVASNLHKSTETLQNASYLFSLNSESNIDTENANLWSAIASSNMQTSYIWGSYRPGLYFGLKTKSQQSFLSTGILWSSYGLANKREYRHSAKQDEIDHMEWKRNDGISFGIEQLVDKKNNLVINASYIIAPRAESDSMIWIQHFSVSNLMHKRSDSSKSFIFYFGIDCDISSKQSICYDQEYAMKSMQLILNDSKNRFLVFLGYSDMMRNYFVLEVSIVDSDSDRDREMDTKPSYKDLNISYWSPKPLLTTTGINSFVESILNDHSVLGSRSIDNSRGSSSHTQTRPSSSIFNEDTGDFKNTIHEKAPGIFLQVISQHNYNIVVEMHSSARWKNIDDAKGHVQAKYSLESKELLSISNEAVNNDGIVEDVYKSVTVNGLNGEGEKQHLQAMSLKLQSFDEQFENAFRGLITNGYDANNAKDIFDFRDIEAAKKCISGLMGGLGFFHGASTVGNSIAYNNHHKIARENMTQSSLTLFTATPSRTSFPRGFLWDEGFHQIVIHKWNLDLSMDIIDHWLSCRLHCVGDESVCVGNMGGWIPRELILGYEAFRVVPQEFVTQRVDIANPPSLLIVFESLLDELKNAQKGSERHTKILSFLERSFLPIYDWINWFIVSQHSDEVFSVKDERASTFSSVSADSTTPYGEGKDTVKGFRWHGRHLQSDKLFPNTLASGLDDYPRSYIISKNEKHLDLYSWLLYAAKVMKEISAVLISHEISDNDILFHGENGSNYNQFYVKVKQSLNASDAYHNDHEQSKLVDDSRLLLHAINKNLLQIRNQLQESLNSVHWSDALQRYADVGYHFIDDRKENIARAVILRCSHANDRNIVKDVKVNVDAFKSRQPDNRDCTASHPLYLYPLGDGRGNVQIVPQYSCKNCDQDFLSMNAEERNRLVRDAGLTLRHMPRVGYVTIFPFLLKLLNCEDVDDSKRISLLLDIIRSPSQLWSQYGLRSISKQDLFYQVENAPGDSPYWRGPIWMNINYLALRSLYFYGNNDKCLERQRMHDIYTELRSNLLHTTLGEYHRTGYFWEHYSDVNGQGMRGHPFAGWTSLIVNIMAQSY